MAEYRLNQQGQQVQTAIDKALALGPATSSSAGTMSAADKSKLDSMNPSNYQPVLVSGTNIKTVNNQSILGPGNINTGSSVTVDAALSSTSENPVQNKVINTALGGKQDTISDLATIRSGAVAGATAVQPSALSAKQDVLVSGTNIKTVNSQSILGSGNLTIGGSNIDTVTVSVDNTSGNPSGSGSVSGSTLSLSFTGLVGATGPQGPQGPQGLQGLQGNTGSSVEYPYELVNNEDTDDATKGHTAAGGKRLKDGIRQLETKVITRLPAVSEDGFFVTDSSGNVGMKYDEHGLDAALLSPNFLGKLSLVRVNEVGVFFVDEELRIGAQISKGGLRAKSTINYVIE